MPSYWKHVNWVLQEADIIIEVLDARMVEGTRNKELEDKVRRFGKKILYVITKCDLEDKRKIEEEKGRLKPSIFISSREHYGTTMLKKKILELSRGERVIVGVVGYPNVGKSSLINALAGRGAAKTSSESGYTKGMQKIRVDSKILLLDTPGVFPDREKDLAKHGRIGAIDYAKIKDPELVVLSLIEDEQDLIEKHYGVYGEDGEEVLQEIALKLKKLRKGGKPDLEATARFVLKEWQTGKIKDSHAGF